MGCSKKQKVAGGVIVGVLVVGAILGLVLGLTLGGGDDDGGGTPEGPDIPGEDEYRRIDCYPEATGAYVEVTRELCEDRGCVYNEFNHPLVPDCYMPATGDYGFKVIAGPEDIPLGSVWYLQPLKPGIFGAQFENVTFTVEYRGDDLLRFTFDDGENERYRVPLELTLSSLLAMNPRYKVEVYSEEPFSFRVIRTSTNTTLWDTGVGGLTLSDQFLQISTRLPSYNIYGLGENVHHSFRHDLNFTSWPMWSRDQPPGSSGEEYNLYSVHPFYECVEEGGNTHGLFLLNSNAMDYSFTPLPMLTYRTIGGILDFFMFLGPTPERVVQQYTQLIGRPYMPPYWALGYQLSRYGYKNTSDMREAFERTIKYNIPIDVQYADIDYMVKQRIFTIDTEHFGELPEYFAELQDRGMSPIIILDPCVEINDTYEPYLRLKNVEGYIKWPNISNMPDGDYEEYNNTDMMGYVWPEWKVVFPDFFYEDTAIVWGELLAELRERLPFDGLWIDMNEVANFDTNNDKPWNWPPDREPYWSLKCTESKWDDPPYRTKAAYYFDSKDRAVRLSDKTICLQGVHNDGELEYNVHSLYGHQQSKVTLPALREAIMNVTGNEVRSMLVTRSTFAGTGQYAGRWLGDNDATWTDLRLSIIGMLEHNLFGIPYIGADICGFFNHPSPELCMRWQQLGAFYPFARNHNHEAPEHQDPGYFGERVANASREALETRYTLLPYLYTLFHHAHTRGSTVVRPLHHEFFRFEASYGIDEQMLWGPALLISPILYEEQTDLHMLIPPGRWYDYYSGELSDGGNEGRFVNIKVEYSTPIPLHLREGYIIPTQEPANNTHYSRLKPFGLKVLLGAENDQAHGDLFWDDGTSIDTYENEEYYYASFKYSQNHLNMKVHKSGYDMNHLYLNNIQIYGIRDITVVYIDDMETHFDYNEETEVLTMSDLQLSMAQDFDIELRSTRRPLPVETSRLDCCPGWEECSHKQCEEKGCVWHPVENRPGVPWCYINNEIHGYFVLHANGDNYIIHKKTEYSMYGKDFMQASVSVTYHGMIARIKITDHNDTRFEVPIELNLPDEDSGEAWSLNMAQETEEDFFFTLSRQTTGSTIIWDTSELGGLILSDQFLQVVTSLHCLNVYGFGEHEHPSLRHRLDYRVWPMFTRDNPPMEDTNLYGVHPFYLCVEQDGRAHGVLILNSHASEVEFTPYPSLIYRTVGGLLDMYFIQGDNPAQVIQQYNQLIGTPFLPPYWSLGFHLSRYGYNNLETLKAAVDRTRDNKIPYDVQHLDIDVLNQTKDFTYDENNFPGLPDYLQEIYQDGLHSFVILDPFLISNDSWYKPYKDGLEQDVYIKWPEGESPDFDIYNNSIMLGWAWPPGRAVFPDFFLPQTQEFWKEQIVEYHDLLPVHGIWIDMNDPANFGTNEERAWNWPEDDVPYWTLKCPMNNELDNPPFMPKVRVESETLGPRISEKTICMSVLQHDDNNTYRHYDVHSLYGWSQAKPTVQGMEQATGERAAVVSRSTFPGNGHYTGHWLGDNASIWPHLKKSIIGILEFNFFGIPYVGADICGYFDDCPAHMCQRWMQLGAFYTFARNHNGYGYTEQDPGVFGSEVAEASRFALETRYFLLPYLYTLFYQAHTQGDAVIRPLFYEFSADSRTWDIDEQFMWGPALLISPVLSPYKTEVVAYFPDATWYDFYTGAPIKNPGQDHVVPAPYDVIPIHVRGGHIIITQEPAVNTKKSRSNPMGLIIALDEEEEARGSLYWDNGTSLDPVDEGWYQLHNFTYSMGEIKMIVAKEGNYLDEINIETVKVLGLLSSPQNVTSEEEQLTFIYDTANQVLLLQDLNLSFSAGWTVQLNW